MSGEDGETRLKWSHSIVEHERRIQLVLRRVGSDEGNLGLVEEDLGGLNLKVPEEDWKESKRAWVRWLKEECDYLDHYRRRYLDEDIPKKHPRGEGCPDCGGNLSMDEVHSFRCEDCGEKWTIEVREEVWLERVDDDS